MAKCNKEPNSGVTVTAWNMGLLCQRCCRGGESELSSAIALDERALKETDTCSNSVFLWHGLAQSLTASLELESSSYRFSFRKRDHHMLNLPVPLIFQGHRDHQSPVHLTNGCQRSVPVHQCSELGYWSWIIMHIWSSELPVFLEPQHKLDSDPMCMKFLL